jgi:cyclase
MPRARVIPCLLLARSGLVKTTGFKDPRYVGDAINTVRIFNEKEVDELILLDIEASRDGREPDYARIADIVDEAFMPIAYGGGVRSLAQAERLIGIGIEKIVVNTAAIADLGVIRAIAERFGSQAVVVGIDCRRDWLGRYRVYRAAGACQTGIDVEQHARAAVAAGAGELMLNDVLRDGTGRGYDLDLIGRVAGGVDVPVIACGGAGSLPHLREAVRAGASAVAAGSLFVFVGRHRAVMISYPSNEALRGLLDER